MHVFELWFSVLLWSDDRRWILCERQRSFCKAYWAAGLIVVEKWPSVFILTRWFRCTVEIDYARASHQQRESIDPVTVWQATNMQVLTQYRVHTMSWSQHFVESVSSNVKTGWVPHTVIWINSVSQWFKASYEVPSLQCVAQSFLWTTPDFSVWNCGRSSRGIFTAWYWGNLSL